MMSTTTEAYIPTDAYHSMIDRIIAAPSAPGLCLRSTLIAILGEAGVWPISCLEGRREDQHGQQKFSLDALSDSSREGLKRAPAE